MARVPSGAGERRSRRRVRPMRGNGRMAVQKPGTVASERSGAGSCLARTPLLGCSDARKEALLRRGVREEASRRSPCSRLTPKRARCGSSVRRGPSPPGAKRWTRSDWWAASRSGGVPRPGCSLPRSAQWSRPRPASTIIASNAQRHRGQRMPARMSSARGITRRFSGYRQAPCSP